MKMNTFPWIAFGFAIIITSIVWISFLDSDNKSREVEFTLIAQNLGHQIEDRLENHEQVLMAFHGLFSASDIVEPNEFQNFYNLQDISNRFPENQGVGFIEYVSDEKRKNEINKNWEETKSDYRIFPEGQRDNYFPVIFLQPEDFRNKRAIGYDVYTEEVRRQTIDRAIETGQTTLTKKIILVQETEHDIQNGFLMIMPVYDFHSKESQSYGKLTGFVYSVFRMNDFIEKTFGSVIFEHIEVKIYEENQNDENLFFDSNDVFLLQEARTFSYLEEINFGDKVWLVSFVGTPHDFEQPNLMLQIPVIGYSMSGLLFYMVLLVSKNIKLSKEMSKKEKIAVIGELSGRFSHDIRNPLSNIRMSVDLLKKDKQIQENENASKKLDIIEKNVERITHQVENVLDFVRTQTIEKKEMSVRACISESIESVNIPQNIKIISTGNDFMVKGDPYQLQIVFKNLLINAIQAIDKEEGTVTIRLNDTPNFVNIVFEDTAEKLHESQIDEIFEPLSTTKERGTGLGLVSCKQIVENHKGKITAKTFPTRFIIRLPKQ